MGATRSLLAAPVALLLIAGCSPRGREVEAVEATIARYNELLRDGYQRQNMTFLREVASEAQAGKLYLHMSALGEGGLRLSSKLRDLQLVRVEFPGGALATVETREVWDFTHYRIATGEKFAEELGFVYRNAYGLRRRGEQWMVERVEVLSGEATNTVIPWPNVERSGDVHRGGPAPSPPAASPGR